MEGFQNIANTRRSIPILRIPLSGALLGPSGRYVYKARASHRCDPGSILASHVRRLYGHQVEFLLGTPVFRTHKKNSRTNTSLSTSMSNITCMYNLFRNGCIINKV